VTSGRERGQQTRAEILQAASRSFGLRGYDATGVAEICREVGISKGAFYHHFPSKQALFLELLRDWLDGIDGEIRRLERSPASVPEVLGSMASTLPEVLRAAEGQVPLFLEFLTKAARDSAVWRATIEPYRRYADYFARLIARGVEEGSIRGVDPGRGGRILVSLAVGLIVGGVMDPGGADWTDMTREAIRMVLGAGR
jgi:AcrR family transcriptional regulator